MSIRYPHAICPPGWTDPGTDEPQCGCMFSTDPRDDQWEQLASETDDGVLIIHCRCGACRRLVSLRLPLPELPPTAQFRAPIITQCCICREFRGEGGEWFPLGLEATRWVGLNRNVSHGYCPTCARMQMQSAQEYLLRKPISE